MKIIVFSLSVCIGLLLFCEVSLDVKIKDLKKKVETLDDAVIILYKAIAEANRLHPDPSPNPSPTPEANKTTI